MANTSLVGGVPDDVFVSRAETAAQLAEQASADAAAAQAAAEQARDDTLAALAAQTLNDHADVSVAGATNDDLLKFQGGTWIAEALSMFELSDVNGGGISVDDVLVWDGSAFVPSAVAAVSGALPLTGGTLTGPLILAGDPTVANEAATRSFVLNQLNETSPYDFGVFFDGVPGDAEDFLRFEAVRNFFLEVNGGVSRASARVAATSAYSIEIQKNGVQIGSIDWAGAATAATITIATATNWVPGDLLQLVGQSSADATLEDVKITLAAILGETT